MSPYNNNNNNNNSEVLLGANIHWPDAARKEKSQKIRKIYIRLFFTIYLSGTSFPFLQGLLARVLWSFVRRSISTP